MVTPPPPPIQNVPQRFIMSGLWLVPCMSQLILYNWGLRFNTHFWRQYKPYMCTQRTLQTSWRTYYCRTWRRSTTERSGTCVRACMHAFMRACMPRVPACVPACVHVCLHAWMPGCLPARVPVRLHACMHACLRCLLAFFPGCLHACSPACLLAYVHILTFIQAVERFKDAQGCDIIYQVGYVHEENASHRLCEKASAVYIRRLHQIDYVRSLHEKTNVGPSRHSFTRGEQTFSIAIPFRHLSDIGPNKNEDVRTRNDSFSKDTGRRTRQEEACKS